MVTIPGSSDERFHFLDFIFIFVRRLMQIERTNTLNYVRAYSFTLPTLNVLNGEID